MLVNEIIVGEICSFGFELLGMCFDFGEEGIVFGIFEVVGVVGLI